MIQIFRPVSVAVASSPVVSSSVVSVPLPQAARDRTIARDRNSAASFLLTFISFIPPHELAV